MARFQRQVPLRIGTGPLHSFFYCLRQQTLSLWIGIKSFDALSRCDEYSTIGDIKPKGPKDGKEDSKRGKTSKEVFHIA
jgi:hypothetical protein